MKIIKENNFKTMQSIRTFQNHMKINENQKKHMTKMKIIRKYQNHMKRNKNHKIN